MKQQFERVMTPYAERCADALEPYREGLLTGQGSLKNSEVTARLKQSMR